MEPEGRQGGNIAARRIKRSKAVAMAAIAAAAGAEDRAGACRMVARQRPLG
ncbi:hypothetical protein J4732_06705 [Serratia marcescens]|uniref:Uncharacterized protein n=1 Tax=Serratia marcescens TaxID=615 RepID=A0A939NPN8_SERMA|nr:hypothetical protein [Serratia marcescens]